MVSVTYFNKQRNEVTMLKEMIESIFQQDKDALEIIETSMGEDVIEQYPKIPTDIDTIVSNIENTENVEFDDAYILEGETKWGGIKFPKGSNVMVFKVMDVKIRRRKIFRLGDYYVSLIHSGLSKWDIVFFTKSRTLVYNDNDISFRDHFYEAQHPHINNGKPCFGSFDTPIRASINSYDISGFLFQVKLYLNNWNYRSPHWHPERFEYHSHSLVNQNFMIDALLNDFNYGRIEEVYGLKWQEIRNPFNFKLISARCKNYETEPFSRILMEQYYWSSNSRDRIDNYALIDLYFYLTRKYDETEVNIFEHPHDCILYIRELSRVLHQTSYHTLSTNRYEWNDNDETIYANMNNFRGEHLKYHINNAELTSGGRIYNDNYLYYLNTDKEQSSEVKSKYNRLIILIEELNNIKYRSNSEEPSQRQIIKQSYKYLGELFQDFEIFDDKMYLLNAISNIEIDTENNNKDKQKIDMIVEEYQSDVKPYLKDAMKTWKINYHETELRRLTNGQSKVNIEELNI